MVHPGKCWIKESVGVFPHHLWQFLWHACAKEKRIAISSFGHIARFSHCTPMIPVFQPQILLCLMVRYLDVNCYCGIPFQSLICCPNVASLLWNRQHILLSLNTQEIGKGQLWCSWNCTRNPNWIRITERTESEIRSFSHWAIMERTESEIHSFSHWAIMTRATGRTDCEIRSFFHRAIMTRATGRTDCEIRPFSHWAIMTWAAERTVSEICHFSHWAIMTRAVEETVGEIRPSSH